MADDRKYLGVYPTSEELESSIFNPIGDKTTDEPWVAYTEDDKQVTYWPSDKDSDDDYINLPEHSKILDMIINRIQRDIFLYEDQYERLVKRGTDSTIKVTDIDGNELSGDVVYTDTRYTFYVLEREGDIPMENTNTEASYDTSDDTLEFTNAEYKADEKVIYVEGAYLDEDGFLAFEESVAPSSPDVEFENNMVNTPYEIEPTDGGFFIVVNEVAK